MRVLTVAAHPDDETLGAGGTMARLAAAGHEVWVCILTDGVLARHGHTDRQQACAERAAKRLGVSEVTFCGLPDQHLDALPLLDVITPIEKCAGALEPDVVLTPFKDDANQDHRIAFAAVLVATRPLPSASTRRVLCYETASSTEYAAPFPGSAFSPNVFVDISSSLSTKLAALQEYEQTYTGEMHPFPHPRSYQALQALAQWHGSNVGVAAAEAFMLVRQVHQEGIDDVLW